MHTVVQDHNILHSRIKTQDSPACPGLFGSCKICFHILENNKATSHAAKQARTLLATTGGVGVVEMEESPYSRSAGASSREEQGSWMGVPRGTQSCNSNPSQQGGDRREAIKGILISNTVGFLISCSWAVSWASFVKQIFRSTRRDMTVLKQWEPTASDG